MAGIVVEAVVVTELVDAGWVAAVAGAASVAVNDDLGGDAGSWEDVFTKDVDAISD